MHTRNTLLLTTAVFIGLPLASAQAGSIETHNNPVTDGDIVVLNGDNDRSDWATISSYQADSDAPLPLLSHGSISIAHDSTRIYFRLQMDNYQDGVAEQSWFGAHHQILIDLDQNRNTGWIGGDGDLGTDDDFFGIGADILIEGPAVWQYGNFTNPGGANQELWTWGNIVPWGGVLYDDGPPSDIEIELLRTDLNNDLTFDFVATTTDISFTTQDIYPNMGVFDPATQTETDAQYFTYDVNYVDPGLDGDLNGDGFVGLDDLDIILSAWNQSVPPANPAADPSGDGFVGLDDLDIVLNNWNAGTPPASVVPEPATLALLGLGGMALLRKRR